MLRSVDAVIVARDNMSWNVVRLHFDGLDLDIRNTLSDIKIDEFGTLEEFGLLSVQVADGAILQVSETHTDATVLDMNMLLRGIWVQVNRVDVYGDDQLVASVLYPQALGFELDEGVLVLDKEEWFSEMIAVKYARGTAPAVYDECVNWEDDSAEDSGTHYEFSAERIRL